MVYRTATAVQVERETPYSVETSSESQTSGRWMRRICSHYVVTAVFYSGKKSPHSAIKQPLGGVMFTIYWAYRDAT
jgi:hypothetical protein